MNIVSTYRLQFHSKFTFEDATAIVPYLHDLGITHVYASPYLKAVAGSTHGYDVIDHGQLNPEVGTEGEYRIFVQTLAKHGMSHILDTVPNHMGVETNENQWWNEVLVHGQEGKRGNYFDIDWSRVSSRPEMVGKLLLPVLGEPYGQVLAKNQLELKLDRGQSYVSYYDRRFPVADVKTDEKLEELLDRQAYRLCYWRVANDEINYRRFFDITGLAALQMQRQEVFDAAHDFTFKLIAEGSVAGLRVDHPDGLLDPKEYFERLQARYHRECPDKGSLFISVEKILNGDESLCEDWPVAGTSGYDFLCRVNNFYIDLSNESAMTEAYESFAGKSGSYPQLVYDKKRLVLENSFNNDLAALANRLDSIAQKDVSTRDVSRRQLREALREVIACFPVYRSYVAKQGVSKSDENVVGHAVNEAAARNPSMEPSVLQFIRDSVLLKYGADADRLDFAQRFQQLTSPVNAKGIEDTAFYIYNRLISLNEVGGDPGRFGRDPSQLHEYFQDRQNHWPLAISSLSTHDTKRSEDVRARLNVLSEIPTEWELHLEKWKEVNADLRAEIDPNDEYLLYQTLAGAWPLESMDDPGRANFTSRISAYMQKALREAKLRTSWVAVNEKYESTIAQFVAALIDPKQSAVFLGDFLTFHKRIMRPGLVNSLSQTVLRLTAPGICDTYQGTELWDFSLVDPDNRRPVDYAHRRRLLAELKPDQPSFIRGLVDQMENGRIKLWVVSRLLRLRRSQPELFLSGSYEPIVAEGQMANHLFAFSRTFNNRLVIVIAPRLVAMWDSMDWGDTHVAVPQGVAVLKNVVSGREFIAGKNQALPASDLFADFPVAVLMPID